MKVPPIELGAFTMGNHLLRAQDTGALDTAVLGRSSVSRP